MDRYYGEEGANPAIEFVTVQPEYLEQHLEMDDMEIEDVKDLQQRVKKVLPNVRPHTNPKVIKKKIVRVQYYGKSLSDVLKQKKLKPTGAKPNSYLVNRAKKKTIPLPQELCIALIRRIEKEHCIWDSTSEHFRNKKIKDNAWNRVAAHVGLPVNILKAKWTSLLGSFRSYNSRYKRGSATDTKPAWFAYELLSFISNEIDSAPIDEEPELSAACPNEENYVPYNSSDRRMKNKFSSSPEIIHEYERDTLLPSNTAPSANSSSTAEDNVQTDAPDSSCNEEILRIVRSMSKVLNKMANIGMAVDYGRYVNQHLREYDDEIRRKTVKGIMDLITAADEEMSIKYPDRSKLIGNGSANSHKK